MNDDGRANSLHYKSGFAASAFIAGLSSQIPGLMGSQGQSILFHTHRLELLESDISNRSAHAVAIHYITDTLTLLGNIGDFMLLAYGNRSEELAAGSAIEDVFVLQLQDGCSVNSYEQLG